MILTRLVLALLVASSITHVSRAQTPTAVVPGYPADGAPAVVTLLSAGAEPRTRLRYTVPTTYFEHVRISKTATMTMNIDGNGVPAIPLPTASIMADVRVTNVSAAREVTYAVACTTVNRDGVDASMPAIQSVDADYRAIIGTVIVSDRGINRVVTFDFTKLHEPAIGPMMAAPWENISAPLPEESVGVGARWEVRQTVNLDAAKAQQKTVYELISVDGKKLVLKATVEQAGGPQTMRNPAMPTGADLAIQKLTGSGTLTITVDLDALVPSIESDSVRTIAAEIAAAGNVMSMSIETGEKVVMAKVK